MGRQESSIEDARKEKKKKSPEQDERAAVGMPSPSVFLSPPSQFSDEGRIPVDADLLPDTEPDESWMLQELIDGLWPVPEAQQANALSLGDELAPKYARLKPMLQEYRVFGYTSEAMKDLPLWIQGLQATVPEGFGDKDDEAIRQAAELVYTVTKKLMALNLKDEKVHLERVQKIFTALRRASSALKAAAISRTRAELGAGAELPMRVQISEEMNVAKEEIDLATSSVSKCLLIVGTTREIITIARINTKGRLPPELEIFEPVLKEMAVLKSELETVGQGLQKLKAEAGGSDQGDWDRMRKANQSWIFRWQSFQERMDFAKGLKDRVEYEKYGPDMEQAIGTLKAIASETLSLEVSNPNRLRAVANALTLISEVSGALEAAAPLLGGGAREKPISLDDAVGARDAISQVSKAVDQCKAVFKSLPSDDVAHMVKRLEALKGDLGEVKKKVDTVVSTQESRQPLILLEGLIEELEDFRRRSWRGPDSPNNAWQQRFHDLGVKLLGIAEKTLDRGDTSSELAQSVILALAKVWDAVCTVERVLPDGLVSKNTSQRSRHMKWTEKALAYAAAKVDRVLLGTAGPLLSSQQARHPVSREYNKDFRQLQDLLQPLWEAVGGGRGAMEELADEVLDYVGHAALSTDRVLRSVKRKAVSGVRKMNAGAAVSQRPVANFFNTLLPLNKNTKGNDTKVKPFVLTARAQLQVAMTPVVAAMWTFVKAARAHQVALGFERDVDGAGKRTSQRKYGKEAQKKAIDAQERTGNALENVEVTIAEMRQALSEIEPRSLGLGKTVDDFTRKIDAPVVQENGKTEPTPVPRFVFCTHRWWDAVRFQVPEEIEYALVQAEEAQEQIERAVETFTGKELSIFSADAKIALHLGEFFAECKKEHMTKYAGADKATWEAAEKAFDMEIENLISTSVGADFTGNTDPAGVRMAGRVRQAYVAAQKGTLLRVPTKDQVLEGIAGFRKSLARSGPRSLTSRLVFTVAKGTVDALLTYSGLKMPLSMVLRAPMLLYVNYKAFSELERSGMPGDSDPSKERWEILRRTLTVYAFKAVRSLIPHSGVKTTISAGQALYALFRDDRKQNLKRAYKAPAVLEDLALAGSWEAVGQSVRTWNQQQEEKFIRENPALFSRDSVTFFRQNKSVIAPHLVELVDKHAALLPDTATPQVSHVGATQFSTETAPSRRDVGALLADVRTDRDRIALIRDHPNLFNSRLAASVDRLAGYFTRQFVDFVKNNRDLIERLDSGYYSSALIHLTWNQPELFTKEHVEFVRRYGDMLWDPDHVADTAQEVQPAGGMGEGLMEQIAGVSSDRDALAVIRQHTPLLTSITMSVKGDSDSTPFNETVRAFAEKYEPLISAMDRFGWLLESAEGAAQPADHFLAAYDQNKHLFPAELVEFVDLYRQLFPGEDEAQGHVEQTSHAAGEGSATTEGESHSAGGESVANDDEGVTTAGESVGWRTEGGVPDELHEKPTAGKSRPKRWTPHIRSLPKSNDLPLPKNLPSMSTREFDAALSARGNGALFVNKWLTLICRRYDVDPEALKDMKVKLTYTDIEAAMHQAHAGGGLAQPGEAGRLGSNTRHIYVSLEDYVSGTYVEKLDKSVGGPAALVNHHATWPAGIPDGMKRELLDDPMKKLKSLLDRFVETGGDKVDAVGDTIARRISDRFPRFSASVLRSGKPLSISVNGRICQLSNCFVFAHVVYFDDDAETSIALDQLNIQLAAADGPPRQIKMLLLQRMMESDVDNLTGGDYSIENIFAPRTAKQLFGMASGLQYGSTVSSVHIDQAASGSLVSALGARYVRHLGDSLSRATITQHDIRLKIWTRVGTAAFKSVGAYLGNMLGAKGTATFAVASQVPALVETMLKDNPRGSAEDLCEILKSVTFDVGIYAMGQYLKNLHDSQGSGAVQRVMTSIKKKIESVMKSTGTPATEKQTLDQWAKGITDEQGGVISFLSRNRTATETYIAQLRDNGSAGAQPADGALQSAEKKPDPPASQAGQPEVPRSKRSLPELSSETRQDSKEGQDNTATEFGKQAKAPRRKRFASQEVAPSPIDSKPGRSEGIGSQPAAKVGVLMEPVELKASGHLVPSADNRQRSGAVNRKKRSYIGGGDAAETYEFETSFEAETQKAQQKFKQQQENIKNSRRNMAPDRRGEQSMFKATFLNGILTRVYEPNQKEKDDKLRNKMLRENRKKSRDALEAHRKINKKNDQTIPIDKTSPAVKNKPREQDQAAHGAIFSQNVSAQSLLNEYIENIYRKYGIDIDRIGFDYIAVEAHGRSVAGGVELIPVTPQMIAANRVGEKIREMHGQEANWSSVTVYFPVDYPQQMIDELKAGKFWPDTLEKLKQQYSNPAVMRGAKISIRQCAERAIRRHNENLTQAEIDRWLSNVRLYNTDGGIVSDKFVVFENGAHGKGKVYSLYGNAPPENIFVPEYPPHGDILIDDMERQFGKVEDLVYIVRARELFQDLDRISRSSSEELLINSLTIFKWGITIATLPLGPKAAFAGAAVEGLASLIQAGVEENPKLIETSAKEALWTLILGGLGSAAEKPFSKMSSKIIKAIDQKIDDVYTKIKSKPSLTTKYLGEFKNYADSLVPDQPTNVRPGITTAAEDSIKGTELPTSRTSSSSSISTSIEDFPNGNASTGSAGILSSESHAVNMTRSTAKSNNESLTMIRSRVEKLPNLNSYLADPLEKCADATREIFNHLKSTNENREIVQLMFWNRRDLSMPTNHFAVRVRIGNENYIIDATIGQFKGIDSPQGGIFLGIESEWMKKIKEAHPGRAIKCQSSRNETILRSFPSEFHKTPGEVVVEPSWIKSVYSQQGMFETSRSFLADREFVKNSGMLHSRFSDGKFNSKCMQIFGESSDRVKIPALGLDQDMFASLYRKTRCQKLRNQIEPSALERLSNASQEDRIKGLRAIQDQIDEELKRLRSTKKADEYIDLLMLAEIDANLRRTQLEAGVVQFATPDPALSSAEGAPSDGSSGAVITRESNAGNVTSYGAALAKAHLKTGGERER